jgi:hypothetical protein
MPPRQGGKNPVQKFRRRVLETEYERLANLLTDREAVHMHQCSPPIIRCERGSLPKMSSTSITKTLPSV